MDLATGQVRRRWHSGVGACEGKGAEAAARRVATGQVRRGATLSRSLTHAACGATLSGRWPPPGKARPQERAATEPGGLFSRTWWPPLVVALSPPELQAAIKYDPNHKTGPRAFIEAVEDAGFEAKIWKGAISGALSPQRALRPLLLLAQHPFRLAREVY